MSSKTRKLIWSVPLMATLAVVGALAVFVALGLPNANPAEAQDGVPGVPGGLDVTAGNMEVIVTWDASTGNVFGDTARYRMRYFQGATAPTADAGWTMDDREDVVRRRVITGLANATLVHVQVQAFNGAGMSDWTTAATDTPTAVAPSAPMVTIEQRSISSIEVSWTVVNDGGSAITAADVEIDNPSSASPAPECTDITGAATMTICTGLVVGEEYEVTVKLTNTIGEDTTAGGMAMHTMSSQVDITRLNFETVITSDSSTGGGSPEFKVVIDDLPSDLPVGSSIVLYLEDDYQEPSSIPASSVYFVADDDRTISTGNGARVYVTIPPKLDTDEYFDATKKDISIRVFIPDMCTTDTTDSTPENNCSGANGPMAEQRLTMVIDDTSGIKNPSEAGKHSVAVRVLGPTDDLPGPDAVAKEDEMVTAAKVALSDNNNKRGYEMIVDGTGYNNGTTATAYVLTRMITPPPSGGIRWTARDDNSRRHDPPVTTTGECRQPVLQDVRRFGPPPSMTRVRDDIICRACGRCPDSSSGERLWRGRRQRHRHRFRHRRQRRHCGHTRYGIRAHLQARQGQLYLRIRWRKPWLRGRCGSLRVGGLHPGGPQPR